MQGQGPPVIPQDFLPTAPSGKLRPRPMTGTLSQGSPSREHIWASGDTQNLACPGPVSTPALALLPRVKGTLWGQKATYCVTGDKGAGDRGSSAWAGHNNSTSHPIPAQRARRGGRLPGIPPLH